MQSIHLSLPQAVPVVISTLLHYVHFPKNGDTKKSPNPAPLYGEGQNHRRLLHVLEDFACTIPALFVALFMLPPHSVLCLLRPRYPHAMGRSNTTEISFVEEGLKAISASDDGEEEESAAGWSHDDLEEYLFLSESPPQPVAEIKPVEVTENTQLPDFNNVEDTNTQLPAMTQPNDKPIPAMQNVMEAPPSTGNTALLQQMEAQPLPEMEAQETSNKCNQSHYEFYDACQSQPPTPAHSTFTRW